MCFPVSVTYIGNIPPVIAHIKEVKKLVRFRPKSISKAHFKVIERWRREKKKHANKTKTTKETKNKNKNEKQFHKSTMTYKFTCIFFFSHVSL